MNDQSLSHTGPQAVIANLALMYVRHNDPARALALGLAAMQLGPVTPEMVLVVATSFLRTGEADQALAALSAFDLGAARFASPPTKEQEAAADVLRAKALFRRGETEAARVALQHAASRRSEMST